MTAGLCVASVPGLTEVPITKCHIGMKFIQQQQFAHPPDPSALGRFPLVIHRRAALTDNKTLVIFVHGLGGTRYGSNSTWGRFPEFLFSDVLGCDIGMYAYATAFRRLRVSKSVELQDEAEFLAHILRAAKEYAQFILVGHSMGGVLCRATIDYLATHEDSYLRAKSFHLVLMASPQLGSLRVPRWLTCFSRDARALEPHNQLVARINDTFIEKIEIDAQAPPSDRIRVPVWAVIAGRDSWVDNLSARYDVRRSQRIKLPESHTSVVKPESRDAEAYLFVRGIVLDAVNDKQQVLESASARRAQSCEATAAAKTEHFAYPDVRSLLEKLFHVNVGVQISPKQPLEVNLGVSSIFLTSVTDYPMPIRCGCHHVVLEITSTGYIVSGEPEFVRIPESATRFLEVNSKDLQRIALSTAKPGRIIRGNARIELPVSVKPLDDSAARTLVRAEPLWTGVDDEPENPSQRSSRKLQLLIHAFLTKKLRERGFCWGFNHEIVGGTSSAD